MGYFAARFPTHDVGPVAAVATIMVLALPALVSTLRWLGPRRGLAVLATLSLFAYVVEAFGIATGWPYGSFAYGDGIGPKVFGFLPVMLPLAYVPLALGATSIAERYTPRALPWWLMAGVASLVAFDLVLDPGAVALGYWAYAGGGPYYGVPLTNYMGWSLSSTVALLIVWWWLQRRPRASSPSSAVGLSAFLSVAMWAGVAVYGGQALPICVAVVMAMLLIPETPIGGRVQGGPSLPDKTFTARP